MTAATGIQPPSSSAFDAIACPVDYSLATTPSAARPLTPLCLSHAEAAAAGAAVKVLGPRS
jgi:hypothetical protein